MTFLYIESTWYTKMDVWTILLGVLGAFLLHYIYHKLKDAYGLFREYFVLWHVATGARGDKRTLSTRARLHAYVCKTNLLDQVSVNQIYSFLISMIDSDVSVVGFHNVLLGYKYVILCRERTDGSLRGAMLLGIDNKKQGDKEFTLVRLGLAFFQRHYQGGPLLYYVVMYHVFRELLFHPRTPIYVVAKAFSYKSYLVLTKVMESVYPRYDAETPEFEQKLIDDFAEEVKMKGDIYHPKRCVIERELSSMKEFVAPISNQELENPHIKFFQETNPGWQKGHQLITLGKVTWTDLLWSIYRAVTRARAVRKEGLTRRRNSKMRTRQLSFQCEEASTYARKHSDKLLNLPQVDKDHETSTRMDLDENPNTTTYHNLRERPVYSTQNSFNVGLPL